MQNVDRSTVEEKTMPASKSSRIISPMGCKNNNNNKNKIEERKEN